MYKDYTKYPREFITYRWYRPILTGILFMVFYIVIGVAFNVVLGIATGAGSGVSELASGGYDSLDVYTALGATISLGNVALMLPALALANLIAGRRTFRSYSSSRGGWNFRIFFKSLVLAFFLCSIPIIIDNVFHYGRMNDNRFTLAGILMLTLMGPMQCIAEEYIFRGFMMQAFGSWFRFAPLAIVISSAIFASQHPYNTIGVVNIFIDGCCFALYAWLSGGLEAGSAFHIANNMAIFYTTGFGYGIITSEITVSDFILSVALDLVFLAAVIYCRKRGMFDEIKADDAAEYNAKVEEKRRRREAGKDTVTFEVPAEAEKDATEE